MTRRHIIVDPFVVATPTEPAQLSEYVAGLAEWLPALARRREECSVIERSVAILLEEGRFPTFEAIAALLAKSESAEYSVVDIRNLLRVVVETEPYLEHHLRRRSVAVEQLEATPREPIERMGKRVEETIEQALVMVALAQQEGWAADGVYWATTSWPVEAEGLDTHAFVTLVELLDGSVQAVNVGIDGHCRVVTRVEDLDDIQRVADLYRDPSAAVMAVLDRLRRAGLPCSLEQPQVLVADGFVESVEALAIHRHPAVLETVFQRAALAAVGHLDGVSGAKLHPVRTSSAADSPQVVRDDGARLWRCMVTKRGAGYRLHFWSLPGGGIELVAVMRESEN